MFMPRKTSGSKVAQGKGCRRNHLTQGTSILINCTSSFSTVDKVAHTSSVYKACKHLIVFFFKDLHEQKHCFSYKPLKVDLWRILYRVYKLLTFLSLVFFSSLKLLAKKRKQCLVNCRI